MTSASPRLRILEEVLSVLDINVETGEVRWARTINSRAIKGRIAGTSTPEGYRKLCYRYRPYLVHRLIWAKAHGVESVPQHLDHIDGDPSNNALSNLRPATQAQNNINVPARRVYAGEPCASKLKGVSRYSANGWSKWRARIRVEGREHSLGYFDTEEEAAEAYRGAAKRFYGEFARA